MQLMNYSMLFSSVSIFSVFCKDRVQSSLTNPTITTLGSAGLVKVPDYCVFQVKLVTHSNAMLLLWAPHCYRSSYKNNNISSPNPI